MHKTKTLKFKKELMMKCESGVRVSELARSLELGAKSLAWQNQQ